MILNPSPNLLYELSRNEANLSHKETAYPDSILLKDYEASPL